VVCHHSPLELQVMVWLAKSKLGFEFVSNSSSPHAHCTQAVSCIPHRDVAVVAGKMNWEWTNIPHQERPSSCRIIEAGMAGAQG